MFCVDGGRKQMKTIVFTRPVKNKSKQSSPQEEKIRIHYNCIEEYVCTYNRT